MKKYWIVFVLVALVAYGCQKKIATQPDKSITGQQDAAEAQKPSEKVEKVTEAKVSGIESKDLGAKAFEEKEGMFQDVLFEYDKYEVKDTYKPVLQSVASWMTKNGAAKLSVEGHCDDRGTNEYNLALGDRRAKAVKDYLVTLGVPAARIDVISYGEEKPLCTQQTEECWTKNRRAHFVVLQKAGK